MNYCIYPFDNFSEPKRLSKGSVTSGVQCNQSKPMKKSSCYFKSLVLSVLIVVSACFSSKAEAAGYQDIAYSVARMATTATFLSLPNIEIEAYNAAFSSIVDADAMVAYALFYLGSANYQADIYGFTGQHYYAYFKYLGVVDAVQRNTTSTFNNYYTPTANSYADYYNDYGRLVWSSLKDVSDLYKSAARVGGNLYAVDFSGASGSSLYSGSTINSSTQSPWVFGYTVPSYPANITANSVPTALWHLGHYYLKSYMEVYGPSLHLNAGYSGWNAAAPYNGAAAYSHFLGNLGKYAASNIASGSISIYYYYVAALYSGSEHTYYEDTALLFDVTYLSTANLAFTSYGAQSEAYYNVAGVTLR